MATFDTHHDPYAFPPTVGNLDLHLWSEGRHNRIYEKLGAHAHTIGDVSGIAFAVWAPNAISVSVVGDFNRWDGRIHMMRVLGSSGIWESSFIPDLPNLGSITNSKSAPRRDGNLLIKADPFANACEVPPAHRFECLRK